MMTAGLRQRLQQGQIIFGPLVQSVAGSVVEVLGLGGFDFVLFDQEHGPVSVGDVALLTTACGQGTAMPMVRLRSARSSDITAVLDCGVSGILVPHVDSAESAAQIVRASRFHPHGCRGLNPYVRAAEYSQQSLDDFMAESNRELVIVIGVEGRAAMEHLADVIAVPGMDAIFFGPYDFSHALGIPGQVSHPTVVDQLTDAIGKVRKAGLAAGVFAGSIEAADRWMQAGAQFIVFSVDTRLLLEIASEKVRGLHELSRAVLEGRASAAAKG